MIQEMTKRFLASYQKFMEFFIAYQKKKQVCLKYGINLDEEAKELNFDENQVNIYTTASNTLDFITLGTIQKGRGEEKKSMALGKELNEMQQKLYHQEVDYSSYACRVFRFQSMGLHIVIINDYNFVFYPVLSMTFQNFQYKRQQEGEESIGESTLKGMLNYYNAQAGEWEPLLEKSKVHLQIKKHGEKDMEIAISFKKILNMNITETMVQTLIRTYFSLQEKQEEQEYMNMRGS
mmetsp:Transcript_43263/g.41639  ORF Transcript_43263/g.41639 Transcript_43263/m.41639 type:complete len:235 (+) Transcript_43263:253-957(+)